MIQGAKRFRYQSQSPNKLEFPGALLAYESVNDVCSYVEKSIKEIGQTDLIV